MARCLSLVLSRINACNQISPFGNFCLRNRLTRNMSSTARSKSKFIPTGASSVSFKMDKLQQANISTSPKRENAKEKKLFTPGPLGVTMSVKEAMLRDVGSRDTEFIQSVKSMRQTLLEIAGVSQDEFSCIPIQGSGTFAVDACFQTIIPKSGGKVLILENGAYGKRMAKICEAAGIDCDVQSFREDQAVEAEVVADALRGRTQYQMVSVVHSETSSGVINPVQEVGEVIREYQPDAVYLVDTVSSFGAIPIDIHAASIDAIVSSANKCLQGVPGFAFVIINNDVIHNCQGNSRSLSLDLYDQLVGLDKSGQFRFTPATHAMLAFRRALEEFKAEGGVLARGKRYAANRDILKKGMNEMGFKELLINKVAGYIISSFMYPTDQNFTFTEFYNRLNDKGFVIYPGKVLDADCFRIGCIGDLHPQDMRDLLVAIKEVCKDMGIELPVKN